MTRFRAGAVFIILGLLLAACSGATESAAAPGDSTAPAESEGAPPASEGETKSGTARLGRGSLSVAFVPTEMTIERMNAMGYDIEVTEFPSTSTEIQAATEGAIDIASASAAATMTAIDAGLTNKFFMARYINEFVLVSKADYPTCESLDGRNVAIHAQTDITGLLTLSWFENNCPDAEPAIQIIDGSENRLAALLQDQLDASPLDLQGWQQLEAERPGEFAIIANFVEDFPVVAGVYSAPPEFLEANEELVKDFIRTHLEVWDEIYADPSILVDESIARLPEVDPELIPGIVDTYLELGILPQDGDLQEEQVQFTIDFFSEAAGFQNVGDFADVVDRTYLDEVLGE
ncbi:MAG TPA: ABC transporter substrate-binding protein [Candidatus Limnocylindria bacterium]